MDHNHSHSHCGDEEGHGAHDHPQDTSDLGPQDNLYSRIDFANCTALNADEGSHIRDILKPWHERMDESKFLKSDADDQLIIRIPFTGSVRLRAVLLKAGPGDQTPTKMMLFANQDHLDFEDVTDLTPTQDFPTPQSRDVGEYAVKTAKFSSVSCITIFFPQSQGADDLRIYYLGFLGHYSERKSNPVITVYEAQANPADHQKIQGTDGGVFSTGQQF